MSDQPSRWKQDVLKRLYALENRNEAPVTAANEETAPPMKSQPFDLTTLFTGVLAVFAFLSFIALIVQLQDARNNFIEDQRPYVWTAEKNVSLGTLAVGNKVQVTVPIANFGKSPAIMEYGDDSVEIGADAAEKLKAGPWKTKNSVLPPEKINYLIGGSTAGHLPIREFSTSGNAAYPSKSMRHCALPDAFLP